MMGRITWLYVMQQLSVSMVIKRSKRVDVYSVDDDDDEDDDATNMQLCADNEG